MDMGPLPKPIFSPIGSRSGITFSPWDPAFPHYSEAWNCLWSLKLQPRLKYMLWKITWNSLLPVRANIGTFIQYGDTDSWTTHHVFLLDCPIARIIWRSSEWPLDTSVFINQPITWWIKAILKPRISAVHPKKGLPWARSRSWYRSQLIIYGLQARNQLIHKAIQPENSIPLKQTTLSLMTHLSAWQNSSTNNALWCSHYSH